jgi:N-acetylmuramoyl-L-alanine amidase
LTVNSLLAGVYSVSFDELYSRIPAAALTESDRKKIVLAYQTWSSIFGLDIRILFAQALLETNGFRFGNLVSAAQCNPCGLGATGPGFPGASFKTWEAGIIAHCAHLALYTFTDHVCFQCSLLCDPRHAEHYAFQAEYGRSLVLSDLGGKWAYSIEYGQNIANVWNRGI